MNEILFAGNTRILWAHGNTAASDPNKFAYHGFGNRGSKVLDLYAPAQPLSE